MKKLKMQSPNLVNANIEKIGALFPNCITEYRDENGIVRRVVDFDLLRQELSASLVEGPQERYTLNWPGKKEAILTANSPIAKTLRPCEEESVDFANTKNIFIEGDNLDALKLLQETYLNKVRMIYIDPPYNTGNDFIYNDNFITDKNKYALLSGHRDEDSNRLFDEQEFVKNQVANGRFHSDWLTMIFPHEFILIYAKDSSIRQELVMRKDGLEEIYDLVEKLKKSHTPLSEAEKQIKKLYKKQGYDRGITLYNSFDPTYSLWGKINMSWPNANTFGPRYEVLHPVTGNPVSVPDRGWRWKKETFWDAAKIKDEKYQEIVQLHDGSVMCGRVWFAKDENTQPSSITYLDDVNTFLLRSILSLKSDGGIEVENIFEGKNYFSYPKPTSLLNILLSSFRLEHDDIILDYFAGSSTTAHAVMQQNAEAGINAKYIMIQVAEPCDEKSEAYKAGFATIAEISKERIRRSGEKVTSNVCNDGWNKDTGFRVFKIDSSNMKDVYYTPDELKQVNLFADHIKPDRRPED
ncbi:MAG: site-specific DNA-methyltransferase, partial [Chlorobium sp.]|nr:site-specific DNA-methyltransferase [Chlorobium sp.]